MKDFHISILTRAPLGDPQLARDVLRVLVRTHEDLRPARYGSTEPLRGRLHPAADVEEVLQHWTNPMLFSNGRRSAVSLWFGNPATHNAVYIDCLSSRVPAAVVATLTRDLAVRLQADLATAYFWRGEQDEWLRRYNAVYPMCLGLTTHDIRRSLPDLAWYSVFGAPYVLLFGRDRLASCPSFRSAAIDSERWELQLTETVHSVDGAMSHLVAARDAAKAHLGSEHFLDLTDPQRQQRTPAFDWAPRVDNTLEEHLRNHGLLSE